MIAWSPWALGAATVPLLVALARAARSPASGSAWRGPFEVAAALTIVAAAAVGLLGATAGPLAALVAGLVATGTLGYVRFRRPTGAADATPPSRSGAGIGAIVVALLIVADLLVAAIAAHLGAPAPAGAGAAALLLAPGFAVVAALEVLTVAIARPNLDVRLRFLVGAEAGLILLAPSMLPGAAWERLAGVVGSGLLVAMFVTILQYLYRTKQLPRSTAAFLVGWTVVATVVAAGWFLWDLQRVPGLLGAALVVPLAFALGVTFVAPPVESGERTPWLLHPSGVFLLLLFTFLAEFFLGAVLDLQIAGRGFLQYIPFEAVPAGAGAAGALAYNGLWFAAAILASAWFLVAIGFTMGPLVLLKAREAHEPAHRYRLYLTVGVYALAAVYIPSFTSSTPLVSIPILSSVPVIGWGFGLRAGGPFEASVSIAVLVMYLAVGVLTVLFGRKALCSVLCGAALMYQGTTINEMRQFNQTSKVGRYFLGSQLSTVYVVASGVALLSLASVSLLAFLHWLPSVQVANGDLDSAALPLPIELYFGGVWFAMFVSTPYIGTYNCATTGFCHWGAISLPFARLGFFRLKVKDKEVCRACTTFDCAKSCPVGLVDMPLYFRTQGEYRSAKCCGVGECVGACPYGNLYHEDVRGRLRKWLGRPAATRPPGTPLPMVPSAAPHPTAAPPSAAVAVDRTPPLSG
ncbi:MAG TPA: hypothetical protein VMG36_03975 [Thermoplasmata archaeon]|nr:hypothetical protein [Thermoplasmata archaeon]